MFSTLKAWVFPNRNYGTAGDPDAYYCPKRYAEPTGTENLPDVPQYVRNLHQLSPEKDRARRLKAATTKREKKAAGK